MVDQKFLNRLLQGGADRNIDFAELRKLLRELGFNERIRGSHHVFSRVEVKEILNLQPRGRNAKAYQAKQVRDLIVRYNLAESR
jgi:hypothetical protein